MVACQDVKFLHKSNIYIIGIPAASWIHIQTANLQQAAKMVTAFPQIRGTHKHVQHTHHTRRKVIHTITPYMQQWRRASMSVCNEQEQEHTFRSRICNHLVACSKFLVLWKKLATHWEKHSHVNREEVLHVSPMHILGIHRERRKRKYTTLLMVQKVQLFWWCKKSLPQQWRVLCLPTVDEC